MILCVIVPHTRMIMIATCVRRSKNCGCVRRAWYVVRGTVAATATVVGSYY